MYVILFSNQLLRRNHQPIQSRHDSVSCGHTDGKDSFPLLISTELDVMTRHKLTNTAHSSGYPLSYLWEARNRLLILYESHSNRDIEPRSDRVEGKAWPAAKVYLFAMMSISGLRSQIGKARKSRHIDETHNWWQQERLLENLNLGTAFALEMHGTMLARDVGLLTLNATIDKPLFYNEKWASCIHY